MQLCRNPISNSQKSELVQARYTILLLLRTPQQQQSIYLLINKLPNE